MRYETQCPEFHTLSPPLSKWLPFSRCHPPSPSPDQMAEDAARRMFDARVGKLHHLVSPWPPPSTFSIPPPFLFLPSDG